MIYFVVVIQVTISVCNLCAKLGVKLEHVHTTILHIQCTVYSAQGRIKYLIQACMDREGITNTWGWEG